MTILSIPKTLHNHVSLVNTVMKVSNQHQLLFKPASTTIQTSINCYSVVNKNLYDDNLTNFQHFDSLMFYQCITFSPLLETKYNSINNNNDNDSIDKPNSNSNDSNNCSNSGINSNDCCYSIMFGCIMNICT